MANSVNLKINIDDDGSLSVVANEAKRAADATEDLVNETDQYSKSSRTAYRNAQGVANNSANLSKNFSKQAQGIRGLLVPAYATLAANVFAISAAFNFFKRAFDVQALEQSQVTFAENTGVALGALTQGLRDASDGMLGFQEAGQAAAIGLAKGFSPQQLNELAEGARKASTALGRDFQDSFDRLIRGASKAEPELLDELGITLRLEEATERYAQAIGKNRKELTAYERSQAVLIETQRQLNENFGDVDAISNPFIKLQKTFEDLVKSVTGAVMPVFAAFADIITRSTGAAVAVFGMVGLTIAKQMIPLEGLTQGFTDFFKKNDEGFTNAINNFKSYGDKIQKVDADIKTSRENLLKQSSKNVLEVGGDKAQKSKILQKMKDGIALTPQEKARIKRSIREAEAEYAKFGKVTKGMFAGVKIALVRDVGGALKMTEKQTVTWGMRFARTMKQSILAARALGAALKVGVGGALKGVGIIAGFTGKMLSKALNMAGFIGLFLMIKEIVVEILNSPHSIIMTLGKAMDSVLGFIMPYVDSLIKGVLSVGDFAANTFKRLSFSVRTFFFEVSSAVLGGADDMINNFIGGINGLIEKLNKFLPEDKRIGLIEFKSELKAGLGAAPVMAELSNMAGTFQGFTNDMEGWGERFAQSISQSYGLEEMERENQRLKKSEEALSSFIDTSNAMGESVEGIVRGLRNTEDAAEKGFAVAEAIGTLNISGALQKITATRAVLDAEGNKIGEMTVLTDGDQIKALEALKQNLGSIIEISPQLASAFKAALANPNNVKGLQDLEALANSAKGNFTAFRTSITQTQTAIREAFKSGDARAAANALLELQKNANASAMSFRALSEEGAAAKVMQAFNESMNLRDGATATDYLGSLQQLASLQETLALSTESANLVQGESRALLDNMNGLTEIALQREAARLEQMGKVEAARAKEIAQEEELRKIREKRLKLERVFQLLSMGAARAGSSSATAAVGASRNAAAMKDLQSQRTTLEKELEKLKQGTDQKAIDAKNAELKGIQSRINILRATGTSETLDALASDFAKLGPEGELMSAVAQGASNIQMAFTTAFEMMSADGATASDKIQASLMAASAVFNAMSQISKAASDQRIRAIDKEIEAEKKRDGKSAESVARLAQLEKKKEQAKRKAFEQDKKMKMAQTVINTATAIVATLAQDGWWAMPLAIMIGAMGAAQLAMIASTSYDGGGSGAGGGMPSNVAVGERRSSVDMARSQGGAGELAYMRGGMGTGGPENFTPAFAGYKNRAEGGNTSFMVGEQGPELFVPQTPGTIVPNDDIAAPAPVNANINISAIDAAGVEDVLMNQRGNIISMIRDAANSQGNTFLEEINVAEL